MRFTRLDFCAITGAALATAAAPQGTLAQSIAPTRDELTREQPAPAPRRPTLNVVGAIERSPCPLADPRYADVKVTIREVRFNNLKGATPEELAPSYASYVGVEQPVAVLCEVRDAAATILRSKGYLAAVQVPTQRIEDGVVTMETLFARVTTVRARGQTGGAEAKLAAYLSKLTEDEIFDRFRAERYLLLARDLPGYNVQLTLKPAGTGPGELIGEVSVLRQAFTLDATVQNLAAEATGRWSGQLAASAFGLTGLGDVTTASFYSTFDVKEQQILQLSHSFRPGSEGLTIDGLFTYAWTKPDLSAPDVVPNLTARTLFATLGARYPLIRRQDHNLWLGGGLDYLNQKVDFFGPLTRDRLRILFLRAQWDAIDLRSRRPKWRAAATLELRRGLDIFDASEPCPNDICLLGEPGLSRADGKPTATLVRAAGNAEVAIGNSFSLSVSPRGQKSFAPLLSFEEFTAGNYTVGRGYDPALIAGDGGVAVAVELRGPRFDPTKRGAFSLQPYVFGDAAWVWNRNLGGDRDHLKSIGGGVRADFDSRFRLDAALARPLERAGLQTKKGDPRLLVTLTSRLLPWR
ncbi:MAG: ShlB/FhaC/HecB family hemolysin secretion/activation protein [Pseudomonadota bacterium]|nr:ShlB/FhaC/HecB family hemolysin secretion/activation protein [Pseudomonadota bacterium]